jgi:hypothetical protein
MRSGLQPVAISFNKNVYYGSFAALVDARALTENASDASNVLRKPILCKIVNCGQLAFSEVRRLPLPQRSGNRWGIAKPKISLAYAFSLLDVFHAPIFSPVVVSVSTTHEGITMSGNATPKKSWTLLRTPAVSGRRSERW